MEFALAFPIFLLFVLLIIDFSRISSISTVLRDAIDRAATAAVSMPNLDIDVRGRTKDDVDYQRLMLGRKKVGEAALRFLNKTNLVLTADDQALADVKGTKLLDIVYTEDRLAGIADTRSYKVAFLRPGECAVVRRINRVECNRRTLGTTAADDPPVEKPQFLMERHPIKVVAYVEFDAFLPFIARDPVRFEQYAYRQPIPQTPFPAFEDPGLKGGFEAPKKPEEHQPVGNIVVPTPTPSEKCQINWNKCVGESIGTGPRCPCANIPDPGQKPFCKCRRDCC